MADWKNLGADRIYNETIPSQGRVLAGVASKVSECFLCGPAVSKIATAARLFPQMVGCNSRRKHVVRGMDDVERGQGPTVADPAFCAERSLSEKEVVVAHAHEFESFFRAHHGGLIAFLRKRTVSYADAEEAAQESCVRLLAYGSMASRPENVWKALLYQIASNLAVDEYRKSQRELVQVDASASEESLPTPSYAPHDLAVVNRPGFRGGSNS